MAHLVYLSFGISTSLLTDSEVFCGEYFEVFVILLAISSSSNHQLLLLVFLCFFFFNCLFKAVLIASVASRLG